MPTNCAATSTLSPIPAASLVPDTRLERGLLDTSVVIDLEQIDSDDLPREVAISSITLAELAAGPHATSDRPEAARRQDRLQRTEAAFDPLPFDAAAARAYGRIYSAVAGQGRKARGARAVDLLIAAVACSNDLPLCTRNPGDFLGLDHLIEVVEV
jgi:predicted nucleic acid-binding protein